MKHRQSVGAPVHEKGWKQVMKKIFGNMACALVVAAGLGIGATQGMAEEKAAASNDWASSMAQLMDPKFMTDWMNMMVNPAYFEAMMKMADPKLVEQYVKIMTDPRYMEMMAKMVDPKTIEPFIKMMTDPKYVEAMMKWADPKVVEPFMKMMTDPSYINTMARMMDPQPWMKMMNTWMESFGQMGKSMAPSGGAKQ